MYGQNSKGILREREGVRGRENEICYPLCARRLMASPLPFMWVDFLPPCTSLLLTRLTEPMTGGGLPILIICGVGRGDSA